jgi:methylated-DNA-protein-cysteine methyltransferase related protein
MTKKKRATAVHRHPRSGTQPTAFRERVYLAIRAVPEGRVASYGGIAAIIGQPRAARAVGTSLCTLPEGSDVPWWRIINRNGEISIKCTVHGPALQRALLKREGVKFDAKDRVDWERYGWDGSGVPEGVRENDDIDETRGRRRASSPRKKKRETPAGTKRASSPGKTGNAAAATKRASSPGKTGNAAAATKRASSARSAVSKRARR